MAGRPANDFSISDKNATGSNTTIKTTTNAIKRKRTVGIKRIDVFCNDCGATIQLYIQREALCVKFNSNIRHSLIANYTIRKGASSGLDCFDHPLFIGCSTSYFLHRNINLIFRHIRRIFSSLDHTTAILFVVVPLKMGSINKTFPVSTPTKANLFTDGRCFLEELGVIVFMTFYILADVEC